MRKTQIWVHCIMEKGGLTIQTCLCAQFGGPKSQGRTNSARSTLLTTRIIIFRQIRVSDLVKQIKGRMRSAHDNGLWNIHTKTSG